MVNVLDRLNVTKQQLEEFCKRHHIVRLSFFGSVVRDDFRPDSDVDVLYEFEPEHLPGLEILDIRDDLCKLLGRDVDFVPYKYLNKHVRDQVLSESQPLYDAA